MAPCRQKGPAPSLRRCGELSGPVSTAPSWSGFPIAPMVGSDGDSPCPRWLCPSESWLKDLSGSTSRTVEVDGPRRAGFCGGFFGRFARGFFGGFARGFFGRSAPGFFKRHLPPPGCRFTGSTGGGRRLACAAICSAVRPDAEGAIKMPRGPAAPRHAALWWRHAAWHGGCRGPSNRSL